MPSQAPTSASVQLNWTDIDGQVTVTPSDEDRYVVKMRDAIRRIKRGGDAEAVEKKIRLLVRELGKWLSDQDGIREAYLTIRDGGFLFLVVKEQAEYDEDFEDNLTALDIQISNDQDLSGITLDVMALPNVSPQAVTHFQDASFFIGISATTSDAK